jgi:hypothetical protein
LDEGEIGAFQFEVYGVVVDFVDFGDRGEERGDAGGGADGALVAGGDVIGGEGFAAGEGRFSSRRTRGS